jgi:hypothetical protein
METPRTQSSSRLVAVLYCALQFAMPGNSALADPTTFVQIGGATNSPDGNPSFSAVTTNTNASSSDSDGLTSNICVPSHFFLNAPDARTNLSTSASALPTLATWARERQEARRGRSASCI